MDWTACPHCGLRVSFSGDCECPGCGERVSAPADNAASNANPFLSPQEANTLSPALADQGRLTLGEQIFTAIVILVAGFVLLGAVLFYFVLVPGSDDPGIFYFIICLYTLMFGTLAVTTYMNLRQHRLLVIPTFLQSLVLCLTVWLLPAGLAGFYLLYQSEKRHSKRPDGGL